MSSNYSKTVHQLRLLKTILRQESCVTYLRFLNILMTI